MLEAICGIIGMILVILGLVEVVQIVTFWVLQTKEEREILIVVPIAGHNEEVEYLLRSAAAQVKWLGSKYQKILCVDCGMDTETRLICQVIAKDYPFIEFCSRLEFEHIFQKIS